MNQNPMKTEGTDNQQKRIIVKNNVTLQSRLAAILFVPAILVLAVIKIFAKGYNTHSFSVEHVVGFSIIAGPFLLYISYKLWKDLGTKVILTDQKIIEKPRSGKGLQFTWREIKKINITKNPKAGSIHFVFSNKKRVLLFDNDSRIFCPPGTILGKGHLSEDAISFILEKIDTYKIPVKAPKGLLAELAIKSGQSPQRQSPPPIPTTKVRKPISAKPSSSQRPTPQ